MNRLKNLFLIFFITVIFFSLTNCSKNEIQDRSVNIYLVALQGTPLSGKTIGCNDQLVPISKSISSDKNEVEAAISELLAAKDTDQLKNFVRGPALLLYQATVAGGTADIYLKGDFNISGLCDIPRIKEQLYETAKQFPDIKTINIYINDQTLESYLALAKKGFE